MKDTENIYVAVTGDLVRSKEASRELMNSLPVAIEQINATHKPLVPFRIQAGDETQGLFTTDSRPFAAILDFCSELFPLKIRWGLGIGSISSAVQTSTAEMRGDAFENSRNALSKISRKKYRFAFISGGNSGREVNIILKLVSGYLDRWDERTYRRYRLYSQYGTIYRVAELEKVTPEAINKYLNRLGIREVLETVRSVDEIISEGSFGEIHQPHWVDK